MTDRDVTDGQAPIDVLVVGAGPTGLALATQLQEYGSRFRIVDRAHMLRDLPPGTYTLAAWHEVLGTLEQAITIAAKESKDVELTFAR